ncbi:hypothetical protein Btru_041864 [Bulinus truncatus]|nr:hypothetical protein Btru_041864 [Bulinus truncatus]
MFSVEAPSRAPTSFILNTSQFQGQFNWSMTYNLDSDILSLYGQLKVISRPSDVDYDAIYTTKTVFAAWFVSHCHTSSLREVYVKRMQKVIDVHIFGTCGTYNCSSDLNRHRDDKSICLPLLTSRYFFYLAFENSICEDYVTEKFFKLFPVAKVVPVVLGGIEYKRYFPPDTFVDASDFDSPGDLAHHLKELAQDKYRYLKILRTQSKYKHYQESWKCKLCEKMTNDHSVQWYPGNNMWSWFVHDRCRNPQKK